MRQQSFPNTLTPSPPYFAENLTSFIHIHSRKGLFHFLHFVAALSLCVSVPDDTKTTHDRGLHFIEEFAPLQQLYKAYLVIFCFSILKG